MSDADNRTLIVIRVGRAGDTISCEVATDSNPDMPDVWGLSRLSVPQLESVRALLLGAVATVNDRIEAAR